MLKSLHAISIIVAICLTTISVFSIVRTNMLKESNGAYSFSKFQLWLWTTTICPAFIIHWGHHHPETPKLNQTSLILLGLAGGTSILSWIINDVNKIKGRPTKTTLSSKGFWIDILSDATGNLSLTRLQQLLFTFAYITIFMSVFFTTRPVEYPDFDNTAFYLMGISQGTYLVSKFSV